MDADVVQGPIDLKSDFLNLLPGYDASWNQIKLLDISRQVQDAENYYYLGVPFPVGPDIFFNQPGSGNVFQTYNGNITVPPFSLLTSITAFSAGPDGSGHFGTNLNSGFKLRIYDKGGKADLIMKQFSKADETASFMTGQVGGTLQPEQDDPFGPYFLLTHCFVMPPGVLNIEITDLSGVVNNMIQILLNFAAPLTRQGTGMQQVTE